MSIPGAASPLLLASAADEEFSIERSLRFNSDDSAYLNFTPSSAGNRKTWTWSAWVKFSSGDRKVLFAQTTNEANEFFVFEHRFNNLEMWDYTAGVYHSYLATNAVFRDYSAWYHIVITYDTTNATADDRHRIYVNGEQITSFSSRTNPSQNFQGHVNTTSVHYLSGYTTTGTLPHNGYYAEVHFIDGQSLAASDFGEYDDNNVWQPKAYSGTYGTNGWHLDFSDATNTTTIAEDSSGNGNDWTANNISVTAGSGNDSLFDSPQNGTQSDTGAGGEVSGNYATLNPLDSDTTGSTLSNGNLTCEYTGTTGYGLVKSSIAVSSGKWYCEYTLTGSSQGVGITPASNQATASAYTHSAAGGVSYYFLNGNVYLFGGSNSAYGDSFTTGDTIGIALDLDNGKVFFSKNGTFGNSGDPAAGTNPAASGLSDTYVFCRHSTTSPSSADGHWNFGQRPFAYSAPSGYKCLCTANLPDPTIADGSTGMDATLWTGDSANRTISGLNHEPDLVWIKVRNDSKNYVLQDSVRGFTTGSKLSSNDNWAEGDTTNVPDWAGYVSGSTSDGFTLTKNGTGAIDWVHVNRSSKTYVGWTWDAGSSTASNTDGSITSSVRANTSAGFSVLTADINSSGGTIGHGLNASPGFIIGKKRDSVGNWGVWHSSINTNQYLLLNSNNAVATSSNIFNGVSSTTFTVGSGWSTTSTNHVFYCWTPVEGYSAFGSYTGNGSADGAFIYTGFRPRWIMVKASSTTGNWFVVDTERDPDNLATQYLIPNLANAEGSTFNLDVLSNGFKWRASSSGVNGSGTEYIYAAFAEHPFKTARAR